jgi:uncharacterized RDD family membrane protein YckC
MSCAVHPDVETVSPCARCGVSYCDDCLVTLREQRLCGNCKEDALRDALSGATPSRLALAGLGARWVALFLDRAMLWILSFSVLTMGIAWHRSALRAMFGPRGPRTVQLAAQIVIALLYFLYEWLMVSSRGQTLGKMLLRVQVVCEDGSPVTGRAAFLRAHVRLLTTGGAIAASLAGNQTVTSLIVVVLALIDYGPGLVTEERVTVHDLLAGTRVVQAST